MAKKTTMHANTAKAHARVVGQGATNWGTDEHLACIRYLALDGLEKAKCTPEQTKIVNDYIREAFKADPELGYASNFKKLLVDCGELSAGGNYE